MLNSRDSLLKPGRNVWTAEHLDELERAFVSNPDTSKGKNFLEKLHGQLAAVSPGAVQLMAELHVVHFLIILNGAISSVKKRSDVEAILSWMPMPVAIPDDVGDTFDPGIAHPGHWMLTRRDAHLAWLIRFSRRWLDEAPDARQRMTEGPWALREFAEKSRLPHQRTVRVWLSCIWLIRIRSR